MLVYRVFTFWLPLLPGVIAYFRLRRTVDRWKREQRPAAAAGADGYTIQTEVREHRVRRHAWQTSSRSSSSAAARRATRPRSTPRARTSSPLVIEGFLWGGLLQQTTEVENYPGFRDGIMGPELMQTMRDQAERFGARFLTDNATRFEPAPEEGGLHTVWVDDDVYMARTVILAMGAEHKKLGVPGEEELGTAAASPTARPATRRSSRSKRDDHRRRRRLRDGGGDLPREVLLEGDDRAPPRRVPRVEDHARPRAGRENIELLTPYVVEEFLAGEGGMLGSARLRNMETGETRELPMSGAFVAVGHVPQSEIVDGIVEPTRTATCRRRPLDPHRVPGMFAAGDLVDHTYRQAITAAGHGLPGGARRGVVPARQPARPHAGGARGTGDLAEEQWVPQAARP